MLQAEAAAAGSGTRPISITPEVAQFTFNETGTEEAGAFEMTSFVSAIQLLLSDLSSSIDDCSLTWSKSCAMELTSYDLRPDVVPACIFALDHQISPTDSRDWVEETLAARSSHHQAP